MRCYGCTRQPDETHWKHRFKYLKQNRIFLQAQCLSNIQKYSKLIIQRVSNSLADTIDGQRKEQSIFFIGVTPLTNMYLHGRGCRASP